jgi:hypothetical protein
VATSNVKRIAPFDPRTKFVEDTNPQNYGSGISRSHTKWFTEVAKQINTSPEIVPVPATLTSAGNPGQIAFDAGFVYFCVATNVWLKK